MCVMDECRMNDDVQANGAHDSAAAEHRAWVNAGHECLKAELGYLARGWSVLSLCPPDHVGIGKGHSEDCQCPGKRPWHLWKKFQEERATERDVKGWWSEHSNANVGMAYGPQSGLVGIDIDGPAGEQLLQDKSGGDLPP